MKHIIATPPVKLKNRTAYYVSLACAVLIIICSLGQLFRLDKTLEAVVGLAMFGGRTGMVFWVLLAVVQVFSLPYLLRMTVSPLMRGVGLVSSFAIPIFWAALVGWQLSSSSRAMGIFGTEVSSLNIASVTIAASLLFIVGLSIVIADPNEYKMIQRVLRKR